MFDRLAGPLDNQNGSARGTGRGGGGGEGGEGKVRFQDVSDYWFEQRI